VLLWGADVKVSILVYCKFFTVDNVNALAGCDALKETEAATINDKS
jgi:hypothetical protein